jgi:hypothetical protein
MPDDLTDLLADHRTVAAEREAAEPGTEERERLDDELLSLQRRILFWSDNVDREGHENAG